MATSVSTAIVQQARVYVSQGNYRAGWELLAFQGDTYAEVAARSLSRKSHQDPHGGPCSGQAPRHIADRRTFCTCTEAEEHRMGLPCRHVVLAVEDDGSISHAIIEKYNNQTFIIIQKGHDQDLEISILNDIREIEEIGKIIYWDSEGVWNHCSQLYDRYNGSPIAIFFHGLPKVKSKFRTFHIFMLVAVASMLILPLVYFNLKIYRKFFIALKTGEILTIAYPIKYNPLIYK